MCRTNPLFKNIFCSGIIKAFKIHTPENYWKGRVPSFKCFSILVRLNRRKDKSRFLFCFALFWFGFLTLGTVYHSHEEGQTFWWIPIASFTQGSSNWNKRQGQSCNVTTLENWHNIPGLCLCNPDVIYPDSALLACASRRVDGPEPRTGSLAPALGND